MFVNPLLSIVLPFKTMNEKHAAPGPAFHRALSSRFSSFGSMTLSSMELKPFILTVNIEFVEVTC